MKSETPMHAMRSKTTALFTAAAVGAGALVLSGCRGTREDEPPRQFIPDMDDSPKFKPQTQTDFFADGRAMRPRVAGTVPFGHGGDGSGVVRRAVFAESGGAWSGIDPSVELDKDGRPGYLPLMPSEAIDQFVEWSAGYNVRFESREAAFRAMVKRGQERFNIYCSVCHGFNGEGGDPGAFTGGLAGRRWAYPVPSLHDPKYLDRAAYTGHDGYVFNVIQHGVPDAEGKPPKMPAYSDKITPTDSWAVVAYLRVLQSSWQEDLDKLPADLRMKYEQVRPPLPEPKQTSMTHPEVSR